MTKWAKRAVAMIFVVDFLVALVLYQQAIISRETIAKPPKPPAVQTYGQYIVTSEWIGADDVDVYVRDPNGNIVYFSAPSTASMHLEHDDLGDSLSGYTKRKQAERVVLRAATPGEYTVNVQMYGKYQNGPTTVTVTLYSLRGNDKQITQIRVTLNGAGSEKTAFRFVLDKNGDFESVNHDQASLICVVNATCPGQTGLAGALR
jgi:hypothetical protein